MENENAARANLEASTEHMVMSSEWFFACWFELGSSWSSDASLGVWKHLLASVWDVHLYLFVQNARVCASLFLCKCPCAHAICLCKRADAGSLAGNICDHRLLLTLKL